MGQIDTTLTRIYTCQIMAHAFAIATCTARRTSYLPSRPLSIVARKNGKK